MKDALRLLHTQGHAAGLIARITLAVVIFPHGCQLLLGWFGGPGFGHAMNYFTQTEDLPWLVGFLVILLQFFGALAILAGFGGRLMAFSTALMFVGMIFTGHLEHGFFMNWTGSQTGEGFEYHLLVLGLTLILMVMGSGQYSVDRWLTREWNLNSREGMLTNAFV